MNTVHKYLLTIWFVYLSMASVFGQTNQIEGTVTFVTSVSAYVQFEDTENIQVGDTIYRDDGTGRVPILVISNKSSRSSVARKLTDDIAKGEKVLLLSITRKNKPQKEKIKTTIEPKRKLTELNGSISAASYTNTTSKYGGNTRNAYRLRLNAGDIAGSKLSLNTYMLYRHNTEQSESGTYQNKGLLNIYALSLDYKDESLSMSLGRKINRKVASLGMIDGLQLEKKIKGAYFGLLGGFRPDIIDNSFNGNLLQYGAYVGLAKHQHNFSNETTLGLLQQTNQGNIDRRYTYFQNVMTLGSKLNLFTSFELDLYNLKDSITTSGNSRLTNLHISTRYRMNKKINLSVSYDVRKRILYYETFRTDIERLLADDESRQGIRARVNYRYTKSIRLGMAYGKRFQSSGRNASDNYSVFISMSQIPGIKGGASVNLNINQSTYLSSRIATVRYNRNLLKNKLSTSTYIRYINYGYIPERDFTVSQEFIGSSLNYRFGKRISLGGLVEYSIRPIDNGMRLNLRLTKRF